MDKSFDLSGYQLSYCMGIQSIVRTMSTPAAIHSLQQALLGEFLQVPGGNSLGLVGVCNPRVTKRPARARDLLARLKGLGQNWSKNPNSILQQVQSYSVYTYTPYPCAASSSQVRFRVEGRFAGHARRGHLPHERYFLRRQTVGRVHQLGELGFQAARFRGQRL